MRKALDDLRARQSELEAQNSALRNALQAAERSRLRYEDLYEFAPLAYFALDEQGLIQAANGAAATLLGCARNALLRQPLIQFVLTEDRPVYRRTLDEATATGDPVRSELRLDASAETPARRVRMDASMGPAVTGQPDPVLRVIINTVEGTQTAEAALRESETAYRLLYEQAPVAYQSLDADGRILNVNPAWLRLLGYEGDEVIGRFIGDFLSPESQRQLPEQFARFKATGTLSCTEVAFLHREGARVVVQAEGRTIVDADGQFLKTHCVLHDISERKRAEEALRESEAQLRDILNNAPALVFIKDLEGRYRFVNRACAEALELDESQIEGKTTHEVFPQRIADELVANDRWMLSELRFRQVEETLTIQGLPRTFLSVQFPLRNPDGHAYAICGISTDITERKHAENALRHGKQVLNTAESLAQVGAWFYDVPADRFVPSDEWRRIHGSDQNMLGLEDVMALIHPVDRERVRSAFDVAVTEAQPYHFHHRILRPPEGEVRHVQTYAEIVQDPAGRVIEVLGAAHDVTDSVAAEEALRRSEERYRTIVETAQEGIWMIDAEARTNFVNSRMAGMLGYSMAEMSGRPLWEFMDEDWQAVAIAHFDHRRAGESDRHEFKFRRKDGTAFWALVATNPVFGPGGHFAGALGMITDIDALKQVEETQAFLLTCGLPASGQDFFEALASYIATRLGMEYVCIDRLEGDGLHARTVAVYNDGKFESNVMYALKDTPCGAVLDQSVCSFPRDVRRLFTKDAALEDLRAESYLGTVLWDSRGQPIGLIAVIGRRPLSDAQRGEALLALVAPRAAGELERREAERSMRESEERLRLALRATHDVIWDWDPTTDTQIWSSSGFETFGWSDIVDVPQNAAWWLERVHPHDRELVAEKFQRVVDDASVTHWEDEYQFQRSDGSYALVYDRAHVLRDANGRALRMIGAMQDVTRRRQAEAELEQHRDHLEDLVQQRTAEVIASEARARQILESSADGLFGIDREGRAIFVNPAACEMLGYTAEQILGQPAHELFHHRHVDGTPYPKADCPTLQCFESGAVSRIDNEVYWHADGHAIPVMYANHPLIQNGEITGAVISFIDMSARNAAEQAREEALAAAENLARARKEFLANMSHEIRTPLNGVLGFAEIGHRHSDDPERARLAFDKILQSGRLLLGVVNDILDYSKIEQGKLLIEAVPVDLVALMRETLVPIEEAARAKGLALQVRKAAGLPPFFMTDPLRLKQILTNLLSNAVKFTRAGSVTLSVRREQDDMVWSVADTGIGMTESQLGRLFEPFEQADGSTTREFGGTGLGLAITGRLVELLGAGINVTSAPGAGSTFELRLPYRRAPGVVDHSLVPAVPQRAGSGALTGLSILLAEDNEINQCVIEANLQDAGARVVTVANGREAVDRVAMDGPDAYDMVLMDVQMPEMDGYEATRRIRRLAPALPIAGQTAHACDEDRLKCLASGMVAHIAKPIAADDLVRLIKQHARRPTPERPRDGGSTGAAIRTTTSESD